MALSRPNYYFCFFFLPVQTGHGDNRLQKKQKKQNNHAP